MADDFEQKLPEEFDESEADSAGFEIPQFALVVSPKLSRGGWHVAVLLREAESPEFYLRSLRVRWPFVVARPTPSSRQSEVIVPKDKLSPTGTTPSRKLVVNWAWHPADDGTQQLRFYVRRNCWNWLMPHARLRVWLALKEQQPPQRRFRVSVQSNPIDWGARRDTAKEIAPPEANEQS